jgi:hypothetical protein
MKKKNLHSKLNLKKHKISNLQQHSLQGGTDSITYVIITTIKIFTELVTDPRICRSEEPTDCTLTSVTTSTPEPKPTPEPATY